MPSERQELQLPNLIRLFSSIHTTTATVSNHLEPSTALKVLLILTQVDYRLPTPWVPRFTVVWPSTVVWCCLPVNIDFAASEALTDSAYLRTCIYAHWPLVIITSPVVRTTAKAIIQITSYSTHSPLPRALPPISGFRPYGKSLKQRSQIGQRAIDSSARTMAGNSDSPILASALPNAVCTPIDCIT